MEEKKQPFEVTMTDDSTAEVIKAINRYYEAEQHIIQGACPDIFNQTTYRLIREER